MAGYVDRAEAGRLLAEALMSLPDGGVLVLGIARGGVEVAAEIARARGWLLDVVVPRKVGAPGNPELGLGAIAPGVRVLDEAMLTRLGVDAGYLEREIAAQEAEIERRTRAYRGARPAPDLRGVTAVVVDDGVATGGTALAAIRWARDRGAERVVFAAPVGSQEAIRSLAEEADEIVCLLTPERFFAVGQWFRDFPQTPDERVVELLGEAVP